MNRRSRAGSPVLSVCYLCIQLCRKNTNRQSPRRCLTWSVNTFYFCTVPPANNNTSEDLCWSATSPPPPQPRAFDCTVYFVHYLAASGENGAACQAVSGQGRQAKRGRNGITTFLLKYKISSLFFVMFALYFQYKLKSKEALISMFFLVHVER